MFNRYLTFYPAAIQFAIFCGITSMCLILGQFASGILFEKLAGIPLVSILSLKEISPEIAFYIKIIQPISLVLSLLLPAALFAYFAYPNPALYLGVNRSIKINYLLLAVLLFAIALPFSSMLEELSRMIPFMKPTEIDPQDKIYEAMLKGRSVGIFLLNTFVICIIPAIAEELLFRGCLQQIFLNGLRKYPYTAMVIVAVVFSAFHGQLSGFLPRVYLGFVLCLVYYFSGNLWYSIVIHFLNNFIIVLLAFCSERGMLPFDYTQQIHIPVVIGLLSFICTAGLFYYLYKKKVLFVPIEVEKSE